MSSRAKPLLRGVLFLVLITGVSLMLWPLGQQAYGRWSQRTLRLSWQMAAKAAPSKAKVSTAPKSAKKTAQIATKPKIPGNVKQIREESLPVAELPPTRVVIPDIHVDAVVLQGMDLGTLRRGPGHDPKSALPGQIGNCVIAAHRNVFGAWFANLDQLFVGSVIELHTPQQVYKYRVLTSEQVVETDTSVLAPTIDGVPRLTLITCTLPASLYRHVITAALVS